MVKVKINLKKGELALREIRREQKSTKFAIAKVHIAR